MPDKLSKAELFKMLSGAAMQYGVYGGSVWRHKKSGDTYSIDRMVFREADMTIEVVYAPNTDKSMTRIHFTRPVTEFVDRFELVHI